MVGIWIGIIGPIDNGIDKIEIADNGIDKIEIAIDTYQDIVGRSVKDVVDAIRVILSIHLRNKSQPYQLFPNLLFCSLST